LGDWGKGGIRHLISGEWRCTATPNLLLLLSIVQVIQNSGSVLQPFVLPFLFFDAAFWQGFEKKISFQVWGV